MIVERLTYCQFIFSNVKPAKRLIFFFKRRQNTTDSSNLYLFCCFTCKIVFVLVTDEYLILLTASPLLCWWFSAFLWILTEVNSQKSGVYGTPPVVCDWPSSLYLFCCYPGFHSWLALGPVAHWRVYAKLPVAAISYTWHARCTCWHVLILWWGREIKIINDGIN